MRSVKIITDSCSDLPVSILEEYGIDYAKMSTVLDGVESPARLEWSAEEAKAHYDAMRQGRRITTAQVSVEEFLRIFEEYLSRGMDIVYIACSSKQSGSVNTGSVVARRVLEKYPEGKIHCIDSLNASMGEGMLAVEAAKLAEAGLGADEIADRIIAIRKTVNQYVTVHSLDALRRAGRVKGPAAFFGNLMGVKPIIISDVNGYQTAFKKVKGREKSLREIVAMLADSIVEPEEQTLYFAHADCEEEEVESIVAMLRETIPARRIVVGYIGPIIGASIGPDAVAIFGFGKPVTFNQGE
jgi:DegV family protein with EDD domain